MSLIRSLDQKGGEVSSQQFTNSELLQLCGPYLLIRYLIELESFDNR